MKKTVVAPQLLDVFDTSKTDIFRSMHCIKIGKIVSFDKTAKTAEIQIQFKRVLPDETIQSYPLLVDCPVFTLQGGGGAIQMPVKEDDFCIVLFADRNIDIWFQNGTEAAPADQRCHDITDGIALVGINSIQDSMADYLENTLKMFYGTAYMSIKNNKLNLQNTSTSLLAVIKGLIEGIQGATAGGYPIVDATGKIVIALTNLQLLLYED